MRVLIADDETVHTFLLEMFLTKWGYEVVSTDSGTEAWRILCEENSPRIVILDWNLPGMDGVEICQSLRRAERAGGQPPTYVLLLTARTQRSDLKKGMAAGADDYLTKPYEPAELQERLLAACNFIQGSAHQVA